MGQVNIEAVGDDALLVIDDTQILMPRDMAAKIGLGLLQVASARGSTLDEPVPYPDRPGGAGA